MGKRLSEDEVLGPKILSRIMELITAMVPFVSPAPHDSRLHVMQDRDSTVASSGK